MKEMIKDGVLFIVFISIPFILWEIRNEIIAIRKIVYNIWTHEHPEK